MTGVILQPSYIPWRGYFHLIQRADVFVFFDDVQYTTRDWRNRNAVRGPRGRQWLTVPVVTKGRREQLIKDVEIDNSSSWARDHMATLRLFYGRAPYFAKYADALDAIYARPWEKLCDLDIELTTLVAGWLGCRTRLVRSSDCKVEGHKTDRLVNLCKRLNITTYVSGPSARDYIVPETFAREKLELAYHEYRYGEYPQQYAPFESNLTILDLLFNCGDESPRYIWGQE
jgi:hypothetical protein